MVKLKTEMKQMMILFLNKAMDMPKKIYTWSFAAILSLLLCSCSLSEQFDIPESETGSLSISFISDPMQAYRVTTKSSDPKDEAEKRINNLYIFFFNKGTGTYLSGQYLTGYPSASKQGGYYVPGEGVTLLKIDQDLFDEYDDEGNLQTPSSAIVYAVANVDASLFQELDEKTGRPVKIKEISDLTGLVYSPKTVTLNIPNTGIPMVGWKEIDLTSTADPSEEAIAAQRTVELESLMARVDVNISLASDETDNNLPAFTLMDFTVKNMPEKVTFTQPDYKSQQPTSLDGKSIKDISSPLQRTIYNRSGTISFSFYMYENIQFAQVPGDWPGYPAEIDDYQKQRYKPFFADKEATSVELHGFYSTYNETGTGDATYEVRYTLYLGSNHTDDFKVLRNHQYKNDIAIKGLLARNNSDGEYTFDARVDIDEEYSKYYISMLRERNHDAHFCVTPMDVYLFDLTSNPTIEVILGEVSEGSEVPTSVPDWIRMEKIPSKYMYDGTLPEELKTTNLAEGSNYKAGHGKRRYFTVNLWTALADKVTVDANRDRVYFYIDENLELSDREATVTLIYKENGIEQSRRTIKIGQVHLLPVETGDGNTIYMEQYEEYLDHYDPLDDYQTDLVYDYLSWASKESSLNEKSIPRLFSNWWGSAVASSSYEDPGLVRYDGVEFTGFILYLADEGNINLNERPRSAVEYCFNKNKRNDDNPSSIPVSYDSYGTLLYGTVYVEKSNNIKWFLPGITQMENALMKYYQIYPEFQNYYYWSVSAGEKEGTADARNTSKIRARATKIKSNGMYEQSGGGEDVGYERYAYELGNGGYALRYQEGIRIRAFRIDLNDYNY